MHSLQKMAIMRPIATTMVFAAIILMGLISLQKMEISLLPSIELPQLTVITTYQNAAPEEIESLITIPLTEALNASGGITDIRSISKEGISIIHLKFGWGTRLDFAVMRVREKLDQVRAMLPQDANRSMVNRFDPNQEPIYQIAFFPRDSINKFELRDFVNKNIKTKFEQIDGVAIAELSGGYVSEIHVDIDLEKLYATGLNITDIGKRLREANINIPAGHISEGNKDILIRSIGEFKNLNDIKTTVISSNQFGTPLKILDIAKVSLSHVERTGASFYDGKECILLSIQKESGKNTIAVADSIQEVATLVASQFERDLSLEIVNDQSRFVKQAISNLVNSLMIGGFLAFIALVLILRNLRSPIILISVLPVSLMSTIVLMYLQGLTINMMTLGGMALGIGMLFDSGNIVLSSIERNRKLGMTAREASYTGVREVTGSVAIAVFTTILVFLPVIFLKSLIGLVFQEMALVITFSLITSLIVSLTLIPMLSALPFWKDTVPAFLKPVLEQSQNIEKKVTKSYEQFLERLLQKPGKIFKICILLFCTSILLIYFVRKEFVAEVDRGEVTIHIENISGSSFESTLEIANMVQEQIKNVDSIDHIITQVGFEKQNLANAGRKNVGRHILQMRILLKKGIASKAFLNKINQVIILGPEFKLEITTKADLISELLSGEQASLAYNISGSENDRLLEISNELSKKLAKVQGIEAVANSASDTIPEYHLLYDWLKVGNSKLSNLKIAENIKNMIAGDVVTYLRLNDEEIGIRIRLHEDDRKNQQIFNRLRVLNPKGDSLYLGDLVTIVQSEGKDSIFRNESNRMLQIRASLKGADEDSVIKNAKLIVESQTLPEGYTIEKVGNEKYMEESFKELGAAFILASIFIYMLLSAQFESLKNSIFMLSLVPLIVVGVMPALLIFNKSINISSFTGMILLIGIIVDSSVLLYEYIHIMKRQGFSNKLSIIEASKIILRPVLLNNATTILALLPVATGIGEGGEFQAPLAVAVIGGLLATAILSLFVTPVLYYHFVFKDS